MNRQAIFLFVLLTFCLVFGLLLSAPKTAQANVGTIVIDTVPSWNGASQIASFGNPNTATYGQLVTVPQGATVLTKFSFFMRIPATLVFRGFVYKWNGTQAANPSNLSSTINTSSQPASTKGPLANGGALFESSPRSTTQGANFEEVVFNIPGSGIQLNEGQQYVLFASVSKDFGPVGTGQWGAINSNVYSGGNFVYQNNGSNTTQWTTVPWSAFPGSDLAFRATFNDPSSVEVPEADTLLLFGGGIGGLATWLGWQWRRVKKRK